jgi:general stress protein 26
MSNDREIKEKARELIKQSPIAIFATLDENGFPQQRPMYTAGMEEDFTLYFATGRERLKCRQIEANPKVSMCWENISEDWSNWGHVMIKGEAKVLDDKDLKQSLWIEEFGRYFPEGPEDPGYVVIAVKPTELIFSDSTKYPPDRLTF